jgi:hypothetical protein
MFTSKEAGLGYSGSVSWQAMWYRMVTGLLNWLQGALPVVISSVVQPRDQMSALRQEMLPPSSRITSGAIQEGVPVGVKREKVSSEHFLRTCSKRHLCTEQELMVP